MSCVNMVTWSATDLPCWKLPLLLWEQRVDDCFDTSVDKSLEDFDQFSPTETTFHAELCNPITRQAIELESCSNPLRIQQVL